MLANFSSFVCIPSQILTRALGGKTGRATGGWDIGVTCIHLLPSNKLLSSLQIPPHVCVIECHRDEVCKLNTTNLLVKYDYGKLNIINLPAKYDYIVTSH